MDLEVEVARAFHKGQKFGRALVLFRSVQLSEVDLRAQSVTLLLIVLQAGVIHQLRIECLPFFS